jgi:hypothetical protein
VLNVIGVELWKVSDLIILEIGHCRIKMYFVYKR